MEYYKMSIEHDVAGTFRVDHTAIFRVCISDLGQLARKIRMNFGVPAAMTRRGKSLMVTPSPEQDYTTMFDAVSAMIDPDNADPESLEGKLARLRKSGPPARRR